MCRVAFWHVVNTEVSTYRMSERSNPTRSIGRKTSEEIMALCSINPRSCAFIAASALLGALLLASPFTVLAQQDKPQAAPEKAKQYRPITSEQIDKHIAKLHDKLQITAPEEAA